MFLCYANDESDDVIGGSTETVQHSIKNISRNIKAVFFKLGTRNVHHKKKQNDTYYFVAMATPLIPVSFSEKSNTRICNLLKQDWS